MAGKVVKAGIRIEAVATDLSPAFISAVMTNLPKATLVFDHSMLSDTPSGKDKPYIFSSSIFVREGANSQKLRTVEEMFDDRVEVSNPGGLLPIVARDFGHKSMTRNPLIFGLFTRMHLVERVASGIPRMQEAMKEANLPEPEFRLQLYSNVKQRTMPPMT